jgi:hypothetical protein
MNREEREQYVIQLYKEGRNVRDIAKLVHMSFTQIGAITNKVKLQADRERGCITVDTEPKSKEAQAFKLFSEGKSPVEVAIALDLDAGTVRAIYYHYWELKSMYKLAQIYDELGHGLFGLIKVYKIFKDLGMGEPDIRKVLELVKANELQNLQWKAEYLKGEIKMLDFKKTKATNHLLVLNRRIDEFEARFNMFVAWTQQKVQVGYMNQGPRMLQGPINYKAAK